MIKLDPKGENGNELDEFKAHQFLEKTEGAQTVAQMRKELKEIDIDFNKYVALSENTKSVGSSARPCNGS